MGTGVTAQPLRTRIALKKELNSVANIGKVYLFTCKPNTHTHTNANK